MQDPSVKSGDSVKTISSETDTVDARLRTTPRSPVNLLISGVKGVLAIFSLAVIMVGLLALTIADKWIPPNGYEPAAYPVVEVAGGQLQEICPPAIVDSLDAIINPDGTTAKPELSSVFNSSSSEVSIQNLDGQPIISSNISSHAFVATATPNTKVFFSQRLDRISGAGQDYLAGLDCRRAEQVVWLSGAATDQGNSAELVLLNPAPNATSVSISGWSEKGPLPDFPVISLAGHSTNVIKLAGRLPGASAISLRVESQGAAIEAFLATHRDNGLTSHGAEWSPQIADIAGEQIIAGVDLSLGGGKLILTNPSKADSVATIKIVGKGEPQIVPGAENIQVPAESVLELDLGGLDLGVQSLSVSATNPLLAAVLVSSIDDSGNSELVSRSFSDGADIASDYAVLGAAEAFTESSLIAPQGVVTNFLVTNLNPREVQVRIGDHTETVPALGSKAIPVTRNVDVLASAPIYGAVKYSQPNSKLALVILPVSSKQSLSADVSLNLRP